MEIPTERLQDLSKREILGVLIEHVTTTEEAQEEKDHRSGRSTDLNLYLLDNQGFEIGSLDSHINHIIQSEQVSGYAKNFVKKHTFSEDILGDDASYIHITTPEKSRVDDTVWISQDEYIWAFTTERQEWRKKTVEKLIKYLPQVERLFLSADHLKELSDDIQDSYVSGFTAEYHAPYAEREATLRFHGGDEEDLRKARKYFDAKPTRIEFDQTNSPTAAIQGASTNEGRLTIQSVRDGSQNKAVDTLLDTSDEYQSLDKESFLVEHEPTHEDIGSGFSVEGFTAIELTDPDRGSDQNGELLEELKNNVLNSHFYKFGQRDENTIRVCDTRHNEVFDLALEAPDIIIYPRESATSLSLREIVQDIFDYDSTYSHEKVSTPIASG